MIFKAIVFVLLALVATTSFATVEKKTYVVHMDRTRVATSNHQQWYEDMMDSVHKLSIEEEEEEETTPPELIYIYQNAISGFAAKLSAKQLEFLERMDGFLFATADKMLRAHTTHTPQFLGLQFNKGLWSESNLASDIVIGVVDSGIWPEHISFHDSGMSAVPSRWKGTCENGTMFSPSNCNKKLIGARFFYKGYETSFGRINETFEYRSPRDASGHGTHTAATAGGNFVNNASLFGLASGSASGMMYTSRISVYKVLWGKEIVGTTSDILTGIDQAVADGVDVISLSIEGSLEPYYIDGTSIASFGAIKKGIPVVYSAGNAGPDPYTVGNTAPWIFTIAASYLDRSFPAIVELGNGLTFEGSSVNEGYSTKQLRLVHGETAGGTNAEYCIPGSLHKELVEDKIAVCQNGLIERNEKGEVVKLAGGVGMILINDKAQGEELIADAHVLPTTSLGVSEGEAIIKYVNSSKNATAFVISQGTVYGTRAPIMAAFSSRGPNSVGLDVIKPDVTAPGVNILAAWPPLIGPNGLESDKRSVMFNLASGTSMSCPHVSGLVALLKSVHKHWSPGSIKSALMTTAYTTDNKKPPISLKYNYSQIFAVSRSNFTCPKNLALRAGDLNCPC